MKLFASDYDGTYWKHTLKGQVDLIKNIKRTKQWQEQGNLFVFATGRPISMMKLEKYIHGIVYDYIVGLNGGIIISKTGDILFRETINNSIARKMMILIQQKDVLHYSVSDGLWGHYHTTFGWRHKSFYLFTFFKLFLKTYGLTLEEALNRPVVQISVKLKSAEEATALRINSMNYSEKILSPFRIYAMLILRPGGSLRQLELSTLRIVMALRQITFIVWEIVLMIYRC